MADDRPPLESFLEQTDQRPPLESFTQETTPQLATASAPQTWGDIGRDVAKQAGASVVAGLENIAATPGHIGNLIGKGYEYFFPPTPEQVAYREQFRKLIDQARGRGIADYLPEPQTQYGKAVRNIGEVATSAAGAGPLRGALLAGIGSEAAGRLTEGTTAEPYARMAGALWGGMRGARTAETSAAEASRRELIGTKMPEGVTGEGSLYKQFDAAAQGAPVNPQLTSVMKQQMRTALDQLPYDTDLAEKLVTKLKANDVSDLGIWRQGMRETLYGKGEGASAKALTGIVDQAIEQSLPAGHVGVGMLQTADREFALMKLAQALDARFHSVEARTAATHSGANLDNNIRQALVKLQDNQRAWHGLTRQEQVRAQNIINGTIDTNMLRRVSNVLGGGGGLGRTVGTLAADAIFGHGAAAATFFLAPMLKRLENQIAAQQMGNLVGQVAGRSMFAPTVGPLITPSPYSRIGRGLVYGSIGAQQTPEGLP